MVVLPPSDGTHEEGSDDASGRRGSPDVKAHQMLWDLRGPMGVPPAARVKERELREQAQRQREEAEEEQQE
eukprot:scaffold233244_cov13-Tisochrysis_lutea.AAC.1